MTRGTEKFNFYFSSLLFSLLSFFSINLKIIKSITKTFLIQIHILDFLITFYLNPLTMKFFFWLFSIFFCCTKQAYHMCNCEDVRLFCNGYYPEVIVMDPFSLEILFMLSSKVNPDWISALHVRKTREKNFNCFKKKLFFLAIDTSTG